MKCNSNELATVITIFNKNILTLGIVQDIISLIDEITICEYDKLFLTMAYLHFVSLKGGCTYRQK